MLGEQERKRVKGRENDILTEVEGKLNKLREINKGVYREKILQIFSYPFNQGNKSYVKKIILNSNRLNIPTHLHEELYKFRQIGLYKNTKGIYDAAGIGATFITNPIGENIPADAYQRAIDRLQTKDIDGQSTQNKAAIADIHTALQGHIVHPTALSVLYLIQRTLETTNLTGITILVAGKNGNFGSMISALLERAGATTIGFNPREDSREIRDNAITSADAMVSVIRGAKYFGPDFFTGFTGPIIDVTTERDDETGKTVGSVDIEQCKGMGNIYIPSINGGVGTTTSALLMGNFGRCIVNTEIARGTDPNIFNELIGMVNYTDFGLDKEIIASKY